MDADDDTLSEMRRLKTNVRKIRENNKNVCQVNVCGVGGSNCGEVSYHLL